MSGDPLAARALFDGERLTLARELRGLLKVELAGAAGVTQAAIGQYENGTTRPSLAMVGQLAMALRVPYEFFVGDRPIHPLSESDVHFRSLRSTSKRQRLQEIARLQLLAEVVGRVESRVRLPDVRIPEVRSSGISEDLERSAERLRAEWELGSGPISDTVRLLESMGSVVVRKSLGTSRVDAFSCWVNGRPYVVLGQDKDPYRSRFDAGHELAHLLMHRGEEPGSKRVEAQAHRFSSALLLPRSAILRELPTRLDWPAWFALKRRWNVSIAALVHRAHDLGVLGNASYSRAMVQISSNGWRTSEPSTGLQPETPALLSRAMSLVADNLGGTIERFLEGLHLGLEDVEAIAGVAVHDPRPAVQLAR